LLELLVGPAVCKGWKQREIGNFPGPRTRAAAGVAGSVA